MRNLSSILVTGGAGFIGSSLIRHLLAQPEAKRVTVLDSMNHQESRNNLAAASQDPRLEVVEGNFDDEALLARLISQENYTGIFHLAAETNSETISAKMSDAIATNVNGTVTLLAHARNAEIPLILSSAADIYGSVTFPAKFIESTPIAPASMRAASLARRDLIVQAAHSSYGQDVIVARISHCYGPGQDRTKLIPKSIFRALRDEPLPIHGSGRQIRDWMHVDDCACGLVTAFLEGRSGRTYHLGANSEHTNLGIVRTILKQLGKPESLITHIDDRPAHEERQALDVQRSLQLLRWKARIPFRSGIENTIRELAAYLRPAE